MKPFKNVITGLAVVVAVMAGTPAVAGGAETGGVADAYRVVAGAVQAGHVPIAVFDLDETLVYSHARKVLSYKEAAKQLATTNPAEAAKVERLGLEQIELLENAYDSGAHLAAMGIGDSAFGAKLIKEMFGIYLGGGLMEYDRDVPCATSFVRDLASMGAHIVYVSSRFDGSQRQGTVKSLARLRMPVDGANAAVADGAELILRPEGMNSIDFKRMAFDRIAQIRLVGGRPTEVVLAFENEPENINAMMDAFPGAGAYFIKGARFSNDALRPGIREIRDYCL
ncbi:MAG: hypothetical protein A2583_06730 [Bdellovibrionales bacterium RIFOXYD1_FULL_53_11]|nr:MAG: hypothetical protein A2583_06730 [Bdellovibrionales bacterium RIFOXYD1_FULL_53_11]